MLVQRNTILVLDAHHIIIGTLYQVVAGFSSELWLATTWLLHGNRPAFMNPAATLITPPACSSPSAPLLGNDHCKKKINGTTVWECGVRQAGEGGGVMGWVIRIIFDPNTRQWGGGGGGMG